MKVKFLIPMCMAVLALAACRDGEKSSLSGGYGSAVLSGQVVTTESNSPQGVEVSVRGTGQTMTLGTDGRFAFGDVPEGATLDFHRATDGTEASFQLDQASGPLVIELGKTTAQRSSGGGRRRGVSRGSKEISEVEGVIRSATADQIVVFSSKKVEMTIALTADTIIRKGGTVLTAADLTVDTRVHVRVTKTDPAAGYTATLVIVQDGSGDDDGNGDDSHAAKEYEGLVRTAGAAQLVIFDSHQREVTFVLTADTVIRKGNTTIAAADLKADWRVHVRATTAADGTITASLVIVQSTNTSGGDDDGENEIKVSGSVTAVAASSLSVQTDSGVVTVQTDASTRIEKADHTIALADIHTGDRVKAEGTKVDATTILAKEIEVRNK